MGVIITQNNNPTHFTYHERSTHWNIKTILRKSRAFTMTIPIHNSNSLYIVKEVIYYLIKLFTVLTHTLPLIITYGSLRRDDKVNY